MRLNHLFILFITSEEDIETDDYARFLSFLVSGIGHKIKSVNNPDLRVELVKEYVKKHFPSHSLLDYALAVEKVTTAKKDTVRFFTFC